MVQCAVFGCKSNNNKKLIRNKSGDRDIVKFFRFPKDKVTQKIWVLKCRRSDKINVRNAFICSKHFLKEHYIRNLQHELLQYSPKCSKKLKPDAVPSENLPCESKVRNDKRDERQRRRESKRMVHEIMEHFSNENIPNQDPPESPQPNISVKKEELIDEKY